jgi:hypothetical protein
MKMTKSWRMSWVEYVLYMEEIRNAYKILDGEPVRKIYLETCIGRYHKGEF